MARCEAITQNLRNFVTGKFEEFFSPFNSPNWYLAVSKITPWPIDNAPPRAEDSVETETLFWRQMLGAKRIDRENVSFVIPRVDWESGVVYDPYRDNMPLFADRNRKRFFVLVDGERVYKCIDNNAGAPSTAVPTSTEPSIVTLSDGYRWKFMYQIPENSRDFLTDDFMPVQFVERLEFNDQRELQWEVQQAAINGAIEFIEVLDRGDPFPFAVSSGNQSTIIQNAVQNTSENESYITLNADSFTAEPGAYVGYTMYVSGNTDQAAGIPNTGNEIGQQRVITSYTQSRVATVSPAFTVPLVPGKTRIEIVPQVRIRGDGQNALGLAKINVQRQITSIELQNVGSNYTVADVEILPNEGDGAPENMPRVRAVMSPPGGHGSNAIKELGASQVMIVSQLDQDESNLLDIQNEFRQFGVIINPKTRNGNIAGTETLPYYQLRLDAPPDENFTDGTYTIGQYAVGIDSRAIGLIVDWEVAAGDTTGGVLSLTNVLGEFNFTDPEEIYMLSPDWQTFTTPDVLGRTFEFQTTLLSPSVYRQVYNATILWNGVDSLTADYFTRDDELRIFNTETNRIIANGKIVSWLPNNPVGPAIQTGTLRLVDVTGNFNDFNTSNPDLVIQIISRETGEIQENAFSNITSVSPPQLQHRSGELIYIQNIKPIRRDREQREEFKIILGF